jgi:hypothetical protein
MEFLAAMFRATEKSYGSATEADARRAGATSGLQAKRILSALRDSSAIPRRQMDAPARGVALRLMRSQSPISRLISRHTRDLLRRHHKAGKMQTPIADREVEDCFVELSVDETQIYEAVENYISTTDNQASAKEKNAVGFVMTIYRRRLSSSFHALRRTLEGCATWNGQSCPSGLPIIVEFTTVAAATDSDNGIGAANGPEHSRAFEPGGDESFATRFDHA